MDKKRKRGGQLHNNNAFKHGFYSDQFLGVERRALGQASNVDLTGEINLLRVQIRRYLEAENRSSGGLDYETRLSALRAVSLAADSLTRLVRLQILLNLQNEDWSKFEERLDLLHLNEDNDVTHPEDRDT